MFVPYSIEKVVQRFVPECSITQQQSVGFWNLTGQHMALVKQPYSRGVLNEYLRVKPELASKRRRRSDARRHIWSLVYCQGYSFREMQTRLANLGRPSIEMGYLEWHEKDSCLDVTGKPGYQLICLTPAMRGSMNFSSWRKRLLRKYRHEVPLEPHYLVEALIMLWAIHGKCFMQDYVHVFFDKNVHTMPLRTGYVRQVEGGKGIRPYVFRLPDEKQFDVPREDTGMCLRRKP